MSDMWTDRLSEYVDGDLTETDRLELERHLERCSPCLTIVTELKAVVARARALEDLPPREDLWPAVARSVKRPSRRVSISFVELIAATLFIAFISGLTVWVVTGRDRSVAPSSAPLPDGSTSVATVPVSSGGVTYDRAVADLLQALDEGRKQLSPRTIDVMERSLSTVDRAINEAKAALDQDPGNVFLSLHLARERQRKLALLRQVQSLAERSSSAAIQ
jgi:anti-sigma factor RsiW